MPAPAPAARRLWRSVLLCVVLLGLTGRAAAQMHKGVELVKADLLADTTAVVPGKAFTVGLRLRMAPHWHTYWQYSGDAGLPTKIDWKLPEGFRAGPIRWPVPEKIVSPGDIINYGYNDEVVLLTEITPPAPLPAGGGEITLNAKATWLVCAEICIPGDKALSLKLPTGGEAQAANAEVLNKYRALLPASADATKLIKGSDAHLYGNRLTFQFNTGGGIVSSDMEFFPLPGDTAEVGHPAAVISTGSGNNWWASTSIEVTSGAKDADQVGGVLVLTTSDGKRTGVEIPPLESGPTAPVAREKPPVVPGVSANPSPGAAPGGPTPPGASSANVTVPAPTGSLWHYLLLGFLGGLILNVMPCVLPVISLKLFSFVKQANEAPARVLRLGLAYAAGIFAWFLGFALLVVILKAGGREVGYSFQLGNKWFIVGLSAVTFVFALNLLGVFEIILPGGVTNAAGGLARREGYTGAFVQGVLATILGSACTAPLLGEALGFAFAASAPVVFAMFAAIAAGMSAPFVLLSARPGWLRFLPKPGEWMERVKQGTGFLLVGTVLWLLWCLRGRGPDTIIWSGALLLVLAVACWVQGAFNTLVSSDRSRWTSRAVIALVVFGGGWFCADQIAHAEPPQTTGTAAMPFAAQLDGALKTGRTVFVDFTADWCVSCRVNERVVLNADPVQKALRDRNAVFLKADYTNFPDDITRLLRQYGRAGVPLYVLYPAGKPDAPIVMPELLTQQIVLDAFTEADHRATPASGKPVVSR